MPTVLFLGAGASAASKFALPTMRDFFDGQSLKEFPGLYSFLCWFYGSPQPQRWNLEEVMGYLDLLRERDPIWVPGPAATPASPDHLYHDLLAYVGRRLSIDDSTACPLHEQLFQRLQQRDSIITTNYDLVADRALRCVEPLDKHGHFHQDSRLGKMNGILGRLGIWDEPPPSLMPREWSRGFLLKLHGSLDWLHCPTPGCHNHENLFCQGTGSLAEGQVEGQPCRFCGAALRVLIVPPVARKHIEDRGRLAFLWNLAWRELKDADRVVVIGLSLPSSDFELRWLLRYACQVRSKPIAQLVIVNKDPAHQENVRGAFSGELERVVRYEAIEDYLGNG